MSILFLIIGTILAVLFILKLFGGSKYDNMLKPLDGDAFPLKEIYSVGLAWQDTEIGKLKGKIGDSLRRSTNLYYSTRFGEFYARMIWAQILSFSHLFLTIGFLGAGLTSGEMSLFCVLVGGVLTAVTVYYFFTYTSGKVKGTQEECEREFPNAISKLALMVNSGVILHDAWRLVANSKEGVFYDLMRASCSAMANGKSEIDAIYDFGVMTNSDDVKKFTSALIQSLERGGGDLPKFLTNQSAELWAHRRQYYLQKGEKAASALLMPIALLFMGVIIIVIAAAMRTFSF